MTCKNKNKKTIQDILMAFSTRHISTRDMAMDNIANTRPTDVNFYAKRLGAPKDDKRHVLV